MNNENKEKKARSRKKTILIVLIAFVSLLIVFLCAATVLFNHYYNLMHFDDLNGDTATGENGSGSPDETTGPVENNDEGDETVNDTDSPAGDIEDIEDSISENIDENNQTDIIKNKNVLNILLIGIDSRKNDSVGRSDAMILISINKDTKKIIVTSFLRDLYVSIPGYGSNRLNAAFAFGGASLLIKTIKLNFNIDIDKYAMVNFVGFTNIIDELDGIDLTVSEAEASLIKRDLPSVELVSGTTYHFTGETALKYARNRSTAASDFGRTERQRAIIVALMNKAKGYSLLKMSELLGILLPEVTTNLTKNDCLTLLLSVTKYLKYDVETFRIPVPGTYEGLVINRMSVIGIDFSANKKALIEKIYN